MKVILTENVKALGSVGDIVQVSPGHARNFLIPKQKATFADENQKQVIENEKKRLAKKIDDQVGAAQKLKEQVDNLKIEIVKRVAGNGSIFGSVSASELAQTLEKQGLPIERRMIVIDNPIKQLGEHKVDVRLFKDVMASFTVQVDMDPNQIEENKQAAERAQERKILDEKLKKEAEEQAAAEAESGEDVESEEV